MNIVSALGQSQNIWKFLEISEVITITLIVQVLIINFGLDFRYFLQKLLFISQQEFLPLPDLN